MNSGPPLILDAPSLAVRVAHQVVDVLSDTLRHKPFAVLMPSAGRTLLATYAALRHSHRASLDWSRVVCLQMDEYLGLGNADPRSFAFQLREELVAPLSIGRFIHFYDETGRLILPLDDYEKQVRKLGGIDCALHGVGRNGHIGFNEPSKALLLKTRAVRLAETTRGANGVAFHRGVTLGLGILGEAHTSIAVLLGPKKREAARKLLYAPAGPANPVSRLRLCPLLSIYLDPEAAPPPQL